MQRAAVQDIEPLTVGPTQGLIYARTKSVGVFWRLPGKKTAHIGKIPPSLQKLAGAAFLWSLTFGGVGLMIC